MMRAGLLLGGALILTFAVEAHAADVELVQDNREFNSIGQNCDEFDCDPPFNNTLTPPTPFGPWNLLGRQNSTVSTQQMQGTGAGSSYSDIGWSESKSVYEVVFQLNAVVEMHLYGDLQTDILWGWPEAGVRLSGPSGNLVEQVINDSSFEDGSFDETVTVLPGEYTIRVWADGGTPIADAWFDFTMDLTPIVSCGFGVELALLLPALMWLGRRRESPTAA